MKYKVTWIKKVEMLCETEIEAASPIELSMMIANKVITTGQKENVIDVKNYDFKFKGTRKKKEQAELPL
jgi:hypothetical protein